MKLPQSQGSVEDGAAAQGLNAPSELVLSPRAREMGRRLLARCKSPLFVDGYFQQLFAETAPNQAPNQDMLGANTSRTLRSSRRISAELEPPMPIRALPNRRDQRHRDREPRIDRTRGSQTERAHSRPSLLLPLETSIPLTARSADEFVRGITPSWDTNRGGFKQRTFASPGNTMQLPPVRVRRREVMRTCKRNGVLSGPFELGQSLDEQLLPASEHLLQGLEHWPDDVEFRTGFDQVVGSIKLTEAPMRYFSWPWEPQPEPPPRVSQKGVPPGKLEPPLLVSATSDTLSFRWSGDVEQGFEVDPAGDFELSEFVVISPLSGVVVRYEVEVAEVDALFGMKAWRSVYRGSASDDVKSCRCSGLRRGTSKVRARVCGTNRFGRGEWSKEVEFDLPDIPVDDQVEIEEIPAAWISIDVGGLEAFDERNEASKVLRAKENLLRSLFINRNVIKVAFTFYGLAGVSDVNDDPSTMSMLQFTNLCSGARLLESEGLEKLSDFDLVFVRASRLLPSDAEQALADAVESSGVAVGAGWKKKKGLSLFKLGIQKVMDQKKGAQMLTQTQFVGALLRLASQMYLGTETIDWKLNKMCEQHIAGHVYDELQLVKDSFNDAMRTRQMGSVLDHHAPKLREIFKAYAAADTEGDGTAVGKKEAKAALETMNVRELNEMCEDIEIFDQTFTTMKLLAIFCKVNIDDDLFEQEEEENTSTELVFEEFEEVVARIFNMAVYQPMVQAGNTANLLDQDGDGDLDDDDIDDLYDECDADKSGSVSVEELAVALRKRLNAGAAYLVARKLVKIADTDGGGTLSREELHEAVHTLSSGGGDGDDDGMELERVFHDWLGSVFLPAALKASRKKKLLGSAEKLKAAAIKVMALNKE